MTSFKPEMDTNTAHVFIQKVLNDSVSDVQSIDYGELSKVFSYKHHDKGYVIHFNSNGERFEKDQYLYKSFSSQGLPMPRIVESGKVDDIHFSIAEKAPGQVFVSLPESEIKMILPDLINKFTKMAQVPVVQSEKYGWIESSGNGTYSSWIEFIDSFFGEEQTGFWNHWYTLFESSFLEREFFEGIYTTMIDLAKCSPKERYLVHGDFHLGNMLTDGDSVTAIIDWEMAMYGDFMFDLGTMHFWTPQLQFPQMVRDAWVRDGRQIPHFEERLLCAMLIKGLDGLRFFAKKDDKDAYDSVKSKIISLMVKT
ncbi:phosphotransferase family protein [Lederbergia citrea]|uniref:phosphotransferase family protein n=1 Tax=Lederbergia citrea TaxID=2833581 RepID=UPI001BC920BE|nr:phosphotransferase [Lederbergia citrea]MBS4179059.1 phosphotransferase [Lederbergia citrea]